MSVNTALFQMLKKAIPALPETCTRIELIVAANEPPVITVDFLVKETGNTEIEHARFELTEIV